MERAEAEAAAAAARCPIHKMSELRMACLKEIRISRQRLELAEGSFRDLLRSIKSKAEENLASRVLGAREEKSNEDMNETRDIEEAILWYKRVLGFRTEGGEGVKFIFNNIVLENADEEFTFTIRLDGDIYKLMNCDLRVEDIDDLIKDLNKTNDLFEFVSIMRERFQAAALNVDNSGIVETLRSWANSKQIRELEETHESENADIVKLVDAMDAGGKDSDKCTLILTEGVSAMALAMTGVLELGRDRYGVFPLEGKVLNVREETLKTIKRNQQIKYIKRILGLQDGKHYDSVKDLRYGSLMIMTDQDQFDTVDLSDNEIVKLENFPYLNRLGTLLINNNRITRINPNIGEYLPKLHTLVLTNNRLVNLVEIDPLASLPKLQTLSLLDNNITKKPNYRLYVIHKLKGLRLLDFRKVKQKERIEAANLFSSKEAEEEAKKEPVKTFTPGEVPDITDVSKVEQAPKVVAPTPEQITAIKAAIVNAQTLEEVARLDKALQSGQIPADFIIPGNNDTEMASGQAKDDKMDTDGPNESQEDRKKEQQDAKEDQEEEQHEGLKTAVPSTLQMVSLS